MASKLNPYLQFNGTAREAMEYYRDVFGGELVINTFGEYGNDDPATKDQTMHAQLETQDGLTLMASDSPPGMSAPKESNISVSLSGEDGDTLRGYSSDRFRNRHSMLMNAEFRWIPALAWDMALFYDAGKVTSRREDLDFDNLKTDFGVGVRFHSPTATPLRIDVAYGSEGLNIVFSGSAAF